MITKEDKIEIDVYTYLAKTQRIGIRIETCDCSSIHALLSPEEAEQLANELLSLAQDIRERKNG